MVCSRTHSMIASSSFDALNNVDRYGMPANVLSVSKTLLVMRTYTSLHVSTSILSRPSMMAISPPVPVPAMRSKCSHGFGTSCRFGALPSVSTNVRCINSWRIMSIEYPRTPPPSSDRMRSGGPFVVSFRRTPLVAILKCFASPVATLGA